MVHSSTGSLNSRVKMSYQILHFADTIWILWETIQTLRMSDSDDAVQGGEVLSDLLTTLRFLSNHLCTVHQATFGMSPEVEPRWDQF